MLIFCTTIFKIPVSLYMYITQKEEICVKFDHGEFYKKLYGYFNLHENQILKPLNKYLLSK